MKRLTFLSLDPNPKTENKRNRGWSPGRVSGGNLPQTLLPHFSKRRKRAISRRRPPPRWLPLLSRLIILTLTLPSFVRPHFSFQMVWKEKPFFAWLCLSDKSCSHFLKVRHCKTFFLVFVGRCGVSSESWWSGLRPRNPAECCWWLFCAIVLLPASVPALHKAQFCRGLSLDIRQPTNHTNSLCDLDLWGLFWRPRNILVIWILLWQKCDIPTHALFLSKIQTC